MIVLAWSPSSDMMCGEVIEYEHSDWPKFFLGYSYKKYVLQKIRSELELQSFCGIDGSPSKKIIGYGLVKYQLVPT